MAALKPPSVCEAIQALANKVTERQEPALRAQRDQARAAAQGLRASATGFVPSGPRRKGEGCDPDEEQGILAAKQTPEGGARLRVTLLAAGFVIGPSGSSVREICRQTGADVRSWSESWAPPHGRPRKIRTVIIEGKRRAVVAALSIISEAVERYVELCGGRWAGQVVDRCQEIQGVQFTYSPPPRAAVPYAAALRSFGEGGGGRAGSPPSHKALDPKAGAALSSHASDNKENLLTQQHAQQQAQRVQSVVAALSAQQAAAQAAGHSQLVLLMPGGSVVPLPATPMAEHAEQLLCALRSASPTLPSPAAGRDGPAPAPTSPFSCAAAAASTRVPSPLPPCARGLLPRLERIPAGDLSELLAAEAGSGMGGADLAYAPAPPMAAFAGTPTPSPFFGAPAQLGRLAVGQAPEAAPTFGYSLFSGGSGSLFGEGHFLQGDGASGTPANTPRALCTPAAAPQHLALQHWPPLALQPLPMQPLSAAAPSRSERLLQAGGHAGLPLDCPGFPTFADFAPQTLHFQQPSQLSAPFCHTPGPGAGPSGSRFGATDTWLPAAWSGGAFGLGSS